MSSFKQIMYWLLINSVGGMNRVKILAGLFEKPQNANELSKNLDIEYKTIRHHLHLLLENNFIEMAGRGYGKTYFISNKLMQHKEFFDEICNNVEKSK